ncbi:unnamed protein product [Orchesella dallaii]|uniref:Ankyrin repeat protein n=1 Tax=Orchesella dallaii TaxID=48710 RepID=A0ABP1RF79_9HEXA
MLNENQLQLIKMLIAHNADVNARDAEDNSTPLHYSVRQNTLPPQVIDIIKLLIEKGADPDATDDDGRTFLHWAPSFFTPQLYHELVTYFDSIGRKKSWKMVTSHSFTHLHCTVIKFEPLLDTLKIFKKNDINFNAQDNDGDSVMFDAIEAGRSAEFLQTLFTFGADWRVPNKKQENALHIAALTGNLSALKLFISLDCDVNATNKFGYTPLHNVFLGHFDDKREAPCMADHEIVEQLLMNGADVNVNDNDGNLAIDLARDRWKIGKTENHTLKLLETYQAI